MLAIAVGMHWDFGGIIISQKRKGIPRKKRYDDYLTKLKCLAQQTNYSGGQIDERLIRICILISAGDVSGVVPVNIGKNIFGIDTPPTPLINPAIQPDLQHTKSPISKCNIPFISSIAGCDQLIAYYKFKYQDAKEYRNELIKYFNDNKNKFTKTILECKA